MKWVILLTLTIICSLQADLTFIVATDSHYGNYFWASSEDLNKKAIYDMNRLPNTSYPEEIGGVVDQPKGVIITGDLTHMGYIMQWQGLQLLRLFFWDGFVSDYGLNGEGLLNYPVLEGMGNHDNLGWTSKVRNSIIDRNKKRKEPINLSENGLHYSWDWEGIHCIQLNIYPGEDGEAEYSFSFLKQDLEERIQTQTTPIIIFHHYGFDGYSDNWWSNEEREIYYELIKDYNIVAIFQGHDHCLTHYKWRNIDVFSSGGVFANEYLVCKVVNDHLTVIPRRKDNWGDWHFMKPLF